MIRTSLLTFLLCTGMACHATAELPGQPWQEGDWMVRGRVIGVLPQEDSSISVVGGRAKFSNEIVPELDFSYFFTDHIAVELILATAKHHAKDKLPGGDIDVGSA